MGNIPNPDEIPPELEDFPFEVEQAFNIYFRLPDRWDGMSGSYLGKDLSPIEILFEIFQVTSRETALDFISIIDVIRQRLYSEKRKIKENEKRSY